MSVYLHYQVHRVNVFQLFIDFAKKLPSIQLFRPKLALLYRRAEKPKSIQLDTSHVFKLYFKFTRYRIVKPCQNACQFVQLENLRCLNL